MCLGGRDHPPPPRLDRVVLAAAEPGQQALLVLACLRTKPLAPLSRQEADIRV
jgi:hypothetical protein